MQEYIEEIAKSSRAALPEFEKRKTLSFEDVKEYIKHFAGEIKLKNTEHSEVRKNKDGTFIIFLNENLSEEERIKSALHELGHVFLHWESVPGVDEEGLALNDADIIDLKEVSATYFVRAFLMPKFLFLQSVFESTYHNICNYKKISQDFKVDEYNVISRGKDLNLWE